MFRPSAPTSMSLSDSFILRYVTVSSLATSFTPTMASSENPLSITVTLLCRLELSCRSYSGPVQMALHRVRSRTFLAHLPPLLCGIRKGYRASVVNGTSPSRKACQRFTPSLGGNFGSSFLQIPHWLSFSVLSLVGQIHRVSSGTLAFAYTFPPFKGYGWTFTS